MVVASGLRGEAADVLVLTGAFAFLLTYLALGVRRLHDLGKSGWWMILAFIPVLNLALFLALLIRPGQKDINQYGLPPESKISYAVPALLEEANEKLWEDALSEFENQRRAGLWAKVFAEANGNEQVAKAKYLQARVAELTIQARSQITARLEQEWLTQTQQNLAREESQNREAYEPTSFGVCPNLECQEVIPAWNKACPNCGLAFNSQKRLQPVSTI